MSSDQGPDFGRIQLDQGVSNKLRQLKARSGISRNYLCRMALCYSLREPRPPSPQEYDAQGQELPRHLLLGEQDSLYVALVQERLLNEGRDPYDDFYEYFVAHTNRGVEQIAGRITDMTDLYDLIPQELKDQQEHEPHQ